MEAPCGRVLVQEGVRRNRADRWLWPRTGQAGRHAACLAERDITTAFGLIGAGNAALFDAIARLGKTEVVCTHHEQAAVMAANGYFRASGKPTVAIVTAPPSQGGTP